MNQICETIYGVLFTPVKTFREISCEKPYKFPLFVVAGAALFLLLLNDKQLQFLSLLSFFSQAISLILYWLFLTFFIDLIARIFTNNNNFNKLLTLSAMSFVPWIFIAPLKLMKNISVYVSDYATILVLCIWLWTVVLQILAISETYNISRKNAIVIFFVPFLGSILYFVWVIDFFVKLFQISNL